MTTLSLRLPQDLKARLTGRARRNHRTLSGEILHLLELALTLPPAPDPTTPTAATTDSAAPAAPAHPIP